MKAMQFSFKPEMVNYYGEYRKLDAQQVGDALSRIGGGDVFAAKPEDIVEAAKPKRSPLHRAFDWDDAVAGHRWRISQARSLVGAIVTEVDSPEGQVATRAFVSVKKDTGFEYARIDQILGDEDWRQQTLRNALDDLRNYQRRYRTLTSVLGSLAEVEQALLREIQMSGSAAVV